MDLSYNSVSGLNMDPTVYLTELATTSSKADPQTKIIMLVAFVVIIIIYGISFYLFGGGLSGTGTGTGTGTAAAAPNAGVRFLEVLLWAAFIILILLNGFQYFFKVDITTEIKNIFTDKPEVQIAVHTPTNENESVVPEMHFIKEVYNIPGNTYTYSDAKTVCKAYGADLATYDQIENTYNKGGEWCNYGWSDGQMALFPTQKETWKKLQNIVGHEHDCGRPGVNGGYIDNDKVKFGINCYGYKPEINSNEASKMQTTPLYPTSVDDLNNQKMLEYWKKKIPEIMLAPFNNKSWSMI